MPRVTKDSETDRFRRRAGVLVSGRHKRAFRASLEQARREWDTQFPEFAVGDPEPAPSDDSWPYPAKLGAVNHGSMHAAAAERAWHHLVLGLCREWWPGWRFPNWHAAVHSHHGARWIAGCLLCDDPADVPLGWIEPFNLAQLIWESPYNLTDPDRHPDVVFWRARYEAFARQVVAAVDSKTDLTRDCLQEIERLAEEEGGAAIGQVYAENDRWWKYLELPPGLTSTDLRKLESEILDTVRTSSGLTEPTRGETTAALQQAGWSKSRIADELGMDQSGLSKGDRKHRGPERGRNPDNNSQRDTGDLAP
jgi:hypothetical protein